MTIRAIDVDHTAQIEQTRESKRQTWSWLHLKNEPESEKLYVTT